jgi:translation elongation factor EF-Ts
MKALDEAHGDIDVAIQILSKPDEKTIKAVNKL